MDLLSRFMDAMKEHGRRTHVNAVRVSARGRIFGLRICAVDPPFPATADASLPPSPAIKPIGFAHAVRRRGGSL